jgi:hypothetical protein
VRCIYAHMQNEVLLGSQILAFCICQPVERHSLPLPEFTDEWATPARRVEQYFTKMVVLWK